MTGLLHLLDSSFGGYAFKDVDEDSIGLGDVEANVGDVVCYKSVHHWEDSFLDDIQIDHWR